MVTICASPINIPTDVHTHTHRQRLTNLYEKLSQLSQNHLQSLK